MLSFTSLARNHRLAPLATFASRESLTRIDLIRNEVLLLSMIVKARSHERFFAAIFSF